jgi:hypothetical protein
MPFSLAVTLPLAFDNCFASAFFTLSSQAVKYQSVYVYYIKEGFDRNACDCVNL